MEEFIGGVILYDETIRQSADDGTPFAELLASKGVVPGIKVDTGAHPMAGFPGEKVTEGLDGLRGRLEEYYGLGARFAKWRAVITIGDGIPTDACIRANAHALARYAALCQEAGLVPIVEPEVLMDADNTIEVCDDVTGRTLRAVFAELYEQDVHLRGTLLKPNMVIAGKGSSVAGDPGDGGPDDRAQLPAARAGARAGHRLPLGRAVRGRGDGEPERDQRGSEDPGRSRSRTGVRYRRRRSRRGAADPRTSTWRSAHSCNARG